MSRSSVLVLFLLSIPPGAAALPDHPHLPDQIVVRLAPSAAAEARSSDRVPVFLDGYGIERMSRSLRALPERLRLAGSRYGFDRVYTLQVPTGTDIPRLAERLERHPLVEYAHPNYLGGGGVVTPDDTWFGDQWTVDNVGQNGGTPDADMDVREAWDVATGRRETLVAVLDTGIDGDHPEFRGRVARGGFDFVNDDFDPEADHPHGVEVSGIIAANANNRFGISGINWRARILPVKLLDSGNGGNVTDLANGVLHTAALGVDVANLSLINYPNVTLVSDAVTFAGDVGVIQIGCHGNDGSSFINYPSSYPEILATGWTNRFDVRSSSSNFTPLLDVVAPGVDVPTTAWNSLDTFWNFSGCSAATPNAVAVASVLLAMDPTLTHAQVKDILTSTADDEVGLLLEDTPGRDDYHGWGRINMDQALRSLGLVSADRIHVDHMRMLRPASDRMEIDVSVVDDLTGVEPGAQVQATLTLPDTSTVPVSAATGSNGTATLVYQPGGSLPLGAYTADVDDVVLAGFVYDPTANTTSTITHDPDLDAVHVQAIDLFDDFDTLAIEVQAVDDDDFPEGGVLVRALLTPPVGSAVVLQQTTTLASSGVARMEYTSGPPELDPGQYDLAIVSLSKSGFTYDPGRNVESSESHVVDDGSGDVDTDTVANDSDNCRTVSNVAQSDADTDGHGDACDVCPSHADPAQRDTDGDGTGNRCDCAPYDASRTGLLQVGGVAVGSATDTVQWHGLVGADYYDVGRGLLSDLDGSDYGACLSNDQTAVSLTSTDLPPTGEGYFYIIRGDDDGCGPGTWGQQTGGERLNTHPAACN